MLEVPCAGEDHRDAMQVASGDDFIVTARATGLHDGHHAGSRGGFDGIGEREESV